MNELLIIAFRWIHIVAACLAVGGTCFIGLIAPKALNKLPEEHREVVFLAMRRGLKMVVHSCILLLLVSGAYNTWANLSAYHDIARQAHPLLGMHILLGLAIFAVSLYVLIGGKPPAAHGRWMAVNIGLMLITLGIASALKYVRDHRPLLPAGQAEVVVNAVDGR